MVIGLGLPGGMEFIVILLFGLLLFGGRLPEVGRSLGRSLMEFRKGLRGLKDEAGLGEIENLRHELTDLDQYRHNFDDHDDHSPEPSSSSELDDQSLDEPTDADTDEHTSPEDEAPEDKDAAAEERWAPEDEAPEDKDAETQPREDATAESQDAGEAKPGSESLPPFGYER